MENKLIPSTQFILNQSQRYLDGHIALNDYHAITLNYAKFLSQPLTLSMFVPVSVSGEVLEYPLLCDSQAIKMLKYEEAKSRCLFEGFKICDRGDETCVMTDSFHLNGFIWKDKTIETLVTYKITLSETAIKQIYG